MSGGNPVGGVYVYGVVDTAADQEVCGGVAGPDGTGPVGIVAQSGIGCVISACRDEDLRAASRETLVRRLLAHQQVIEQVTQEHTVLPVKFGTTLDSPGDVRALLAHAHHDLGQALDLMRDKVEVEVAATWDLKRALQEVAQEQEVARAREAFAASGCPTLDDKVRLGQVVKACLDRRRDACRERMLEVLQPLAVDVAPNALLAEEMVMNVAFLVERERQQEFDEQVRVLDSLFDNQFTFRVIGPLPPYSFSTVEVTHLSQEQVEQARQELELPAVFMEAEVRRAYRRLAAQEQRKASPGASPHAGRLARARQASEVLLAWRRAQASHPPAADGGSLTGNGKMDCLFVVAVHGTRYQEINAARFGVAVRV
jgi:hypothetical protein